MAAVSGFPWEMVAFAQILLGTWLGSTCRRELFQQAGRLPFSNNTLKSGIRANVDVDLVFRVHNNKLTLPCYAGSRPRWLFELLPMESAVEGES